MPPELPNSRLGRELDEPPRDVLKLRPSGGREEKGRGLDGRGPENELEPVLGRELEDELADEVRGLELELELANSRLGREFADEPAPLLNDFFGSIYCSKRPDFAGLN